MIVDFMMVGLDEVFTTQSIVYNLKLSYTASLYTTYTTMRNVPMFVPRGLPGLGCLRHYGYLHVCFGADHLHMK